MKKPVVYLFSIAIIFWTMGCNSGSNNDPVTMDTISHHADSSHDQASVTAESEKPAVSDVKNDSSEFSKVLSFKNISFKVSANGKGSLQKLTIQPSGLLGDNDLIKINAEPVAGAEVGDLNLDGFPELLIFTQSAGSGSYGNVLAYSVNAGKSISQVTFLTASQNSRINKGYRGHDRFKIVNNQLVHTFPVYQNEDANAIRSGKSRVVRYKLKDGEASRIFEVEKVTEAAADN